MSTNNWFAQVGPKRFGPLTFDELKRLVSNGVVTAGSFVSLDGTSWQEASRISGLGLTNSPTQAVAPAKESPSSKPDTASSSPLGSEQWYVQDSAGKQFGPVAFTELLCWAMAGNITGDCLVHPVTDSRWKRADEVFPHLSKSKVTPFVAAPTPPPPPPQPQPNPTPPFEHKSDPKKDKLGEEILAGIGILAVGVVVFWGASTIAAKVIPAVDGLLAPVGGLFFVFFIGRLIFRAIVASGRKT